MKNKTNGDLKGTPFVVICGSMAFFTQILSIRDRLERAGVRSIVPAKEDDLKGRLTKEQFDEFKRNVSLKYLKRIKETTTFGILAVNITRHGTLNYIGPNTFAEIALAFAHSKRIYLLNGIPEAYKDELEAWRAQPLQGNLAALISDYERSLKSRDHRASGKALISQDQAALFT